MFVATIIEAQSWNGEYATYQGIGRSLRSAKSAMQQAKITLARSFRTGGSRRDPDWTGTPIFREKRIVRNNQVIHEDY